MVVGAAGLPSLTRAAETLIGLGLACGGASALNHVIDRDIDRLMGSRTSSRPVAAGRVPAAQALEFGLALSAASFALLAGAVNLLAACLALAGNLFYVFVYTCWLKRSTRHNIVIGGAAGAMPPLVGYAAATGRLDLVALLLFLLVFVWTPPHFWALALLLRRQYEQAGIPMLPVVAGERETTRQIVAYTVLLVGLSVIPFAVAGFGVLYLTAAVALGALFLCLAVRLRKQVTPRRAGVLFHYSLAYLCEGAAVGVLRPGGGAQLRPLGSKAERHPADVCKRAENGGVERDDDDDGGAGGHGTLLLGRGFGRRMPHSQDTRPA
jgi:protoheme IX farnesyltransferase